MNIKIGIIAPTENEIKPYIVDLNSAKTSKHAMLTFYEGEIDGIKLVVLYCGVCKVNAAIAAQLLIDKFSVTHIIVSGVAGGLDKVLEIGDTVISTQVTYHDVADEILTEYHPWMSSIYFNADKQLIQCFEKVVHNNEFCQNIYFGKIVTGEVFIHQDGRIGINEKYEPLCVDMETASVAHVCYANSVPFIAVRSMSDTEEHGGDEAFKQNSVKAALNTFKVVKAALKEINSL